jgi:hypothetical protein
MVSRSYFLIITTMMYKARVFKLIMHHTASRLSMTQTGAWPICYFSAIPPFVETQLIRGHDEILLVTILFLLLDCNAFYGMEVLILPTR